MTKFMLFGGKGGVGKTTCAAATALHLANTGYKTLIVSTDPAHSLCDSFEKEIGSEETKITKNLFAVEIDPKENLEKLKEKFKETEAVTSMPEFGGMDMNQLAGPLSDLGSMPGMDEMTAFDKFLQYIDSKEYDYVVFDTAPTGHTLKFLSLPDIMNSWVGKMLSFRNTMSNAMQMFKQILPFSEEGEKDKSLEHLQEMKARIEKGKIILTNPITTEFHLVMIPQEMSITESERMTKQLNANGILIKDIIVNQVQPKHKSCDFCNERRTLQDKKLKEIGKRFKKIKIKEVPLSKEEVKGINKLGEFWENLK